MRSMVLHAVGLALAALFMSAASAAAPLGAQTASGYTYTIRVTASSPGGNPGITGGAGAQSYAGHATTIAARGRLDITDGGIETLFAKGDYLLFDSTDVVIVHPSQQEYLAISRESSTQAVARFESLGFAMKLSEVLVSLDSLGAGDTVSAMPTRRYRLTMAFNLAMDAGAIQQRLGSRTVTDYWVAAIPGLPPNPLLRSNGLSGAGMTGMFKSLSDKVDSVSKRMGRTIALRTISTTSINAGPGQMMESRQSSEVSQIQPARVDIARLVIPASYKAVTFPGALETKPGDGAKWKAPPR